VLYVRRPYPATFGDQVRWFEADLKAAHARRSPERPWIIGRHQSSPASGGAFLGPIAHNSHTLDLSPVVGHRPIYTSNAQKHGVPKGYAEALQKVRV
jgi:hypothetical protein